MRSGDESRYEYMQRLVTFGSYWNLVFSCAAVKISTASVYVRLERERDSPLSQHTYLSETVQELTQLFKWLLQAAKHRTLVRKRIQTCNTCSDKSS